MVKRPYILSNKFIAHIHNLESTRKKSERLFSQGKLARKDIEQIYKGLFIDVYNSFENFIEDFFIGLMTRHVRFNDERGKPKLTVNSKHVRAILYGGNSYIDWMKYDECTIKKAKIFFYGGKLGGKPFIDLDNQNKEFLKHIVIIRNALAHNSPHSRKLFKKNIIIANNLNLPPHENNPVGFIRGIYRNYPTNTRYELYANILAGISRTLTT